MIHRRKLTMTLTASAAAGIAAAALAGCGGGSPCPGDTAAPTGSDSASTLALASTGLGRVLVNGQGRTLYLFKADHGTTSACAGACATAWPPLRASGKPSTGTGLLGLRRHDHQALGWQSAGDLPRPSPLHVRRGPEAG